MVERERSRRRAGRPPEAEREQRRAAALEAALAELTERGYESLTMAAVARRASSSKESLYSWFGSKEGMVAALIRAQSARTGAVVEEALGRDVDPRTALHGIGRGLLDLLLSDVSLALNRAAMTSPALAAVLLEHGRHTTGPLVESYLQHLADAGDLDVPDPAEAFRLFYGLVVTDAQIRTLLGAPAPPPAERDARARTAVDRFFVLLAPPSPDEH